MSQSTNSTNLWQSDLKRNTKKLALWTFAWLCTTALLAFGSKYLWDYDTLFSSLALAINIGVGVMVIIINKRHLSSMDEMMKKIQLDAMAISLGVGIVLGLSYEQLGSVKLINFQPEISHLVIIMALVYGVSVLVGQRKLS